MMTETLVGVSPLEKAIKGTSTPAEVERAAVRELVKAARARGDDLTGPEGLLKMITKTVIESALDEEMAEHVGYDKHAVEGRNRGNSRNGRRTKTVLTDNAGPVQVAVSRDRDGTFEPVIVKKRQRRLSDVDTVVLSPYANGLTTGAISAHFAEVYGASVSKDTVSRITDRVVEDMQAWTSRPMLPVYAAVFIDVIYVRVRDGQVGNRPFYAAIGVDLDGHRDVLGLWAGNSGGESAKFWMAVLTDLKNRGVRDIFFVVCDGLKGLPDSVNAMFPLAIVQACIIHLIPAHDWHVPVRLQAVLGGDRQATCARSTPPSPQRPPRRRWPTWKRSGTRPTRRSRRCGAPAGSSSFHSWTTRGAVLEPAAGRPHRPRRPRHAHLPDGRNPAKFLTRDTTQHAGPTRNEFSSLTGPMQFAALQSLPNIVKVIISRHTGAVQDAC
jgi:Transposase, Mutator family